MDVQIKDGKKISSLKDEFSKLFPFLKIEFFKRAHGQGHGSPKSEMITGDLTIGEIRKKHITGEIGITAYMKVGELERMFEERYGIHIQVFRKSGDIWLETSATDQWTLGEQNETGREMSLKTAAGGE